MPCFLIRTQPDYEWPEEPYVHNKARVAVKDASEIWLVVWPVDPVVDLAIPGGVNIGGWNVDGTMPVDEEGDPLYPTDPLFYELRSLGNNLDGLSTGQLQYNYADGWEQRNLELDRLYPEANDAMALDVRYWDDTTPGWEGIGWRAEILHVAAQRAPNARAIGIYTDADCANYLYTTGAFILQDSDWQVDDEGNPLQVWATNNPAGRAYSQEEPVHFALLYGSAQEGHNSLLPGITTVTRNYWEHDLGEEQQVQFLSLMNAIPAMYITKITFNRLLIKWHGEQVRVTWAQIINNHLVMLQALKELILEKAVEAGLREA